MGWVTNSYRIEKNEIECEKETGYGSCFFLLYRYNEAAKVVPGLKCYVNRTVEFVFSH